MLNKSNGTSNFKLFFLKKGQRLSPKFLPLTCTINPDSVLGKISLVFIASPSSPVTLWFGIPCETWIKQHKAGFGVKESFLGGTLARIQRTSSGQELYFQGSSLVTN